MKPILTLLAAAATMLLLPSCVTRIADLTFASTKNIDLNHTGSYTTNSAAKVSGKDTAHLIICIPTGQPSPKEAIDKAIEQGGTGCIGLSNAVMYSSFWYIPYVYGQAWYKAEGNPVYKQQ